MMAREEYIRIYRSSVPGATPPSLTSGEIAANLVDGKLFVGATNADGSLRNVVFNDVRASVTGIAAGHGLSASGSTGTITLYNMGVTGANVGYGLVSLTGSQTGTVSFAAAGLTTTSSLDSLSVQGNDLYLSLGQHTNLIRHSQDYVSGASNWSTYGGIATPTNIGTDNTKGWPGGATGGISITFQSNSNNGIYQVWPTGSLQKNTTYTVSCWARSNTGTEKCRWSYYDNQPGGQISYFSDDFDLTTTAQRVAFTFTTLSDNTVSNVAFGNGSGSAAGVVLAWGFQLERGRFATDPIRTFGATGASTPRILQVNSGVTGVVAGHGLSASGSTGTITLYNMGVTSFNGLTGTVNYYPPFATDSVTGVAAFNNKEFGIVSGVVSSRGVTGISAGNTGIAIDGATGEVVVSNLGVLSFNGSTGHISVSIGQTVTGDGGALIGANNSLITARLAETGKTGVASFNSTYFTVNNAGSVSLNAPYTITGNTLVSGIAAGVSSVGGNTVAINNLGVTGIEVAANHGLSASGITGTITLRNMGVTGVSANTNSGITISGTTGHVVFALANTGFSLRDDSQQSSTVSLGDTLTITGGTGVVFRKTSEDNYAIYSNFTINGAPPNGNDFTVQTDGKLSIPFATESVTGVASFPLEDFGVSTNGQVSLTGNVARTNTTNTFTQLQTLQGGITGTTATFRYGDIDYIYAQEIGLSSNASGLFWYGGDNRAYPPFIGFPQSGDDTIHIVGGGIVRIGNPSSLGPDYPGNAGGIVIDNGTLSIEDITTINGAVRTVNGLGNNVTLTGDGGAILGRGTTFSARLATDSLTGVASFPPTFFSVANGAVSLSGGISFRDSFNTTDVVNYNETFTLTGFGSNGIRVESAGNNTFRFTNLGVTSFNGQAGVVTYYPPIASVGATGLAAFRESNFDVSGTGAVSIKSGGVPNTALANSSVTVSAGTGLGGGGSVSLGNTVTLTNRGVTSFNGLTGAVTLTGDGGAVRGVNNNAITARIVDCNGASGVVAFDCSIFTINNGVVTGVKTINPGAACESCAATAANSTECNACQGLGCNCQWFANMGGGGVCVCNPIAFDGNGFASEYDVNGNLAALYLDINNLNSYTGSFASKTDNYVLFFDSDEAGTLKTKKASLKTFFLNNLDTLLESKTTSQITRSKGGDSIEFRAVLGNIQAGEEGLIKGASAFDYIESNTVKAINGCTGGTFEITGTVQEVTVTTGINCRQIVIGLPDSVRIPHISGTGGTFSGTITANKFVGSMDGGLF